MEEAGLHQGSVSTTINRNTLFLCPFGRRFQSEVWSVLFFLPTSSSVYKNKGLELRCCCTV